MQYACVHDYVKGWNRFVEGEGRTWHATVQPAFRALPKVPDDELVMRLVGWLELFRQRGYAVNVSNSTVDDSWTIHLQGNGLNLRETDARLDVCLTRASVTAHLSEYGNPAVANDAAALLTSMQDRATALRE